MLKSCVMPGSFTSFLPAADSRELLRERRLGERLAVLTQVLHDNAEADLRGDEPQ